MRARSQGRLSVMSEAPVRDDKRMENDTAGRAESGAALTEVNTWFAERGFRVVASAIDYSEAVRASPWGKRASSRDHHVWVDLARPDGTVVSAGYGSGLTLADAAINARRRWQVEQEGGTGPGPGRYPDMIRYASSPCPLRARSGG